MNTDEWINLLARDAVEIPKHSIERRFAVAALAGLGGGLVLVLALFGLRPGLMQDLALPMLWGKFIFAAMLAGGCVAVLRRLARPGMGLAHSLVLLALPLLVLWGTAVITLVRAEPAERLPLILGSTWRTCPFNIAALSVPALVASFWALRGAAPTRLAWTGAAGGLLAGALGALAYALHCPEMATPFLAVWYIAGMALPTALGALLGPRLLRW
ncbi:DUF1109 domain-containing protein [Acidovorax soli]|uniref:DUF1109 domain-containing protein n=1 Tax=Acidovorax TaxID=12916 RepID=UPI0026F153BB|nr:DUF1109 domain-containing protein [Acidovorax soli]MCM2348062.1 DUF1109 domain-containing protein [Acidovorax soli]